MNPIDEALSVAWELELRPYAPVVASAATVTRRFALGDPQTSAEKLFRVLAANGLLGDDGLLAPDVGLLAIGDYFDYPDPRGRDQAGREGLAILAWLAHHPPEKVRLLAGNHDLCRVMELAHETDASFRTARSLAEELRAIERTDRERAAPLRERFHREHPRIPTPDIARRDFSSFSEAQRRFLQQLLLARRRRLAAPVRLESGAPALAVHAGVTRRELGLLGLDAASGVGVLADGLNQLLDEALERVRADWEQGRPAALDLAPVHVVGTTGSEGGGLLYHRPANPERPGADKQWEFRPEAPRRFDPRALPKGLVQLAGHTGHRKCVDELGDWVTAAAREAQSCAVRTLRSDGDRVVYDCGLHPPGDGEAALVLIDASIDKSPAEEIRLLRLG